jgi:hypothetical protein
MTILFRPQGGFGWVSYTTSRDTINRFSLIWRLSSDLALDGIQGRNPLQRLAGKW